MVPDGGWGGGRVVPSRVMSGFPDRSGSGCIPKREFRMAAETCKEKINRLIVRIPPIHPRLPPHVTIAQLPGFPSTAHESATAYTHGIMNGATVCVFT